MCCFVFWISFVDYCCRTFEKQGIYTSQDMQCIDKKNNFTLGFIQIWRYVRRFCVYKIYIFVSVFRQVVWLSQLCCSTSSWPYFLWWFALVSILHSRFMKCSAQGQNLPSSSLLAGVRNKCSLCETDIHIHILPNT